MLAPVISWYFRQRHEELLEHAEFAVDYQEQLFNLLLESGQSTAYGAENGFKSVRNYEDYRNKIKVSEYEDLKPWIERTMKGEQMLLWPGEINWFAKSSGTTSNSAKYIPISFENLELTHFKGGRDMLTVYFAHYPESKMMQGKGLLIGGSFKTNDINPRSFSGDLSAVLMNHLPMWANMMSTPQMDIAMMEKWEEKLEPMARATMNENVTSISGVPTWVIVLFERLLEITGKSDISEIWPNLELFCHGGVNFTPYREQFKKLIPKTGMHYLETYNASEGFFGLQFNLRKPDFTLLTNHGTFYEFYPCGGDPQKCIPIWEVETGIDYAMVITTNSGLWRYKLGDTVRFSSTRPYEFRITGRTKLFINAFGEELVIENAETAMAAACKKSAAMVADYTAAPVYMSTGKGGHEWFVEFETAPENLELFKYTLDEELKICNGDYAAKRRGDLAMHEPVVHVLPKGLFHSWLKSNNKLGVQNKIPRLSNDRKIAEEILGLLMPERA
ncbi:MAG: GH3 auxin-responsive promoter family protein [Bacteroidetes bacterium]|nr:GH3 auxin-responsive promoter family protein [Bacteroidota bacterium]